MKLISDKLLDEISERAKKSPRRRMNYNFHENESDPLNRLLNAMEPDTYLPPHRHKDPDKEEVFLVLRGSIAFFIFDDEGNVTFSTVISPDKGIYGLDLEKCAWHSLVVLEENTIVYEVKLGPYSPLKPENFAPWAPAPSADKNEQQEYNRMLLSKLEQ
jgi:cupin fold WbuC family metalloprotein